MLVNYVNGPYHHSKYLNLDTRKICAVVKSVLNERWGDVHLSLEVVLPCMDGVAPFVFLHLGTGTSEGVILLTPHTC